MGCESHQKKFQSYSMKNKIRPAILNYTKDFRNYTKEIMAKSYYGHNFLQKVGINVPFSQLFQNFAAVSIDMRLDL